MKNIIFYLLVLVLIYSCKAEKTCPAFDQSNIDLIPYNEGDTVNFISNDNREFNIFINDFDYSKEFIKMCPYYKIAECPCLNSVQVIAKNSLKNETDGFLEMEQSDVSDMQYYKYQILDFYFEIDFINELPYADDFEYLKHIDKLTINNKEFIDIAEIVNTNATDTGVNKVFVTKKDGIIKFLENNSAIEWTIVK